MKANTVKSITCPRCDATVHRSTIQQFVNGKQVDIVAYCPDCGHYWIANRTAHNRSERKFRRRKRA